MLIMLPSVCALSPLFPLYTHVHDSACYHLRQQIKFFKRNLSHYRTILLSVTFYESCDLRNTLPIYVLIFYVIFRVFIILCFNRQQMSQSMKFVYMVVYEICVYGFVL